MKKFVHCVVDEDGGIISLQEIPSALAELMARSNLPVTVPTEKDGVISHGIWFDPEDFDPHLKPEMNDEDRETVAAMTEAIVRSAVLTMRPDLAHHSKLDYWLDLARDAIFIPRIAEQSVGLSNREIYLRFAEQTIDLCDQGSA